MLAMQFAYEFKTAGPNLSLCFFPFRFLLSRTMKFVSRSIVDQDKELEINDQQNEQGTTTTRAFLMGYQSMETNGLPGLFQMHPNHNKNTIHARYLNDCKSNERSKKNSSRKLHDWATWSSGWTMKKPSTLSHFWMFKRSLLWNSDKKSRMRLPPIASVCHDIQDMMERT